MNWNLRKIKKIASKTIAFIFHSCLKIFSIIIKAIFNVVSMILNSVGRPLIESRNGINKK